MRKRTIQHSFMYSQTYIPEIELLVYNGQRFVCVPINGHVFINEKTSSSPPVTRMRTGREWSGRPRRRSRTSARKKKSTDGKDLSMRKENQLVKQYRSGRVQNARLLFFSSCYFIINTRVPRLNHKRAIRLTRTYPPYNIILTNFVIIPRLSILFICTS